jgi:hypothetical protein
MPTPHEDIMAWLREDPMRCVHIDYVNGKPDWAYLYEFDPKDREGDRPIVAAKIEVKVALETIHSGDLKQRSFQMDEATNQILWEQYWPPVR